MKIRGALAQTLALPLLLLAAAAIPKNRAWAEDWPLRKCALHFVRAELLEMGNTNGSSFRDLYHWVYLEAKFHPEKQIRDQAFKIFSEKVYPKAPFFELYSRTPSDIKTLVTALAHASKEERADILGDIIAWKSWAEKTLENAPKPIEKREYVDYQGHKIEKEFLKSALELQQSYAQRGFRTEFVPGRTAKEDTRSGRGVLVIRGYDPPKNKALVRPHPDANMFQVNRFQEYFRRIRKEGGALIVDPDQYAANAAAYFWQRRDVVPGKKWVIAVNEETTWSTFVHEWQHKIDSIDHQNELPGMLSRHIANRRKSAVGRGMHEFGTYLERRFLTELNATGAQFGLHFETKAHSPFDLIHVISYRGQNQRKVAIGRIAMDPLNPKHYLLLMSTPFKEYVFVLPVGSPLLFAGGLIQVTLFINKERVKESQARYDYMTLKGANPLEIGPNRILVDLSSEKAIEETYKSLAYLKPRHPTQTLPHPPDLPRTRTNWKLIGPVSE